MSTQNIFSMVDTWNAAGTTFVGIGLNVTDTASAAGSLLMDLQVGGSSKFQVTKNGKLITATLATAILGENGGQQSGFGWTNNGPAFFRYESIISSFVNGASVGGVNALNLGTNALGFGSSPVTAPDLTLFRDAADTLAQRNGTNAQAFRVYGTFTDVSNYERAYIDFTASRLAIGNSAAGTGVQRDTRLQGAQIRFDVGSLGEPWQIASSGHFLCPTDNIYDIGAFNDTRPRYGYFGTGVSIGGGAAASVVALASADGVLRLVNYANTDFSRLQFGGTTSSFPALKRNSTALETKLADDSAYAPHAMQYLDINDGITAPAAATGRARIYVDTADGDLKVIFADGTIKTISTDT
jgi:hypothetical protein